MSGPDRRDRRQWLRRWMQVDTGLRTGMRDEAEIREQYEFLADQLDSEEMNHESVRRMFTYYKRALGWVLEEEYI